jgi:hypothetical protein
MQREESHKAVNSGCQRRICTEGTGSVLSRKTELMMKAASSSERLRYNQRRLWGGYVSIDAVCGVPDCC